MRPAQLLDHLKKTDMAKEAERLLVGTGWLPEVLRTRRLDSPPLPFSAEGEPGIDGNDEVGSGALPAFLVDTGDDEFAAEHLIAAD